MATLTSALVWEAIRKDVIGFERISGLPVAVTDGLEVRGLPAVGHEGHCPGKGSGFDIALERGVEPGQPVRVQSGREALGGRGRARAGEGCKDPPDCERGPRYTEPVRGVVLDDSHGLLPSWPAHRTAGVSLPASRWRAAERTRLGRIPGEFRRAQRGGANEEGVR